MTNAIILHGKPNDEEYTRADVPPSTNFHWIPWIQKQLIIKGIKADAPLVPEANNPQYDLWKKEFERFEPTEDTVAVGHSCGGGFLVRWLSDNSSARLKKTILVAPWLDPDKRLTTGMFDFEIDPSITERTELIIFVSDNDVETIHKTVERIQAELKDVRVINIPGKGHFTYKSMRTTEFPELLKEVLA